MPAMATVETMARHTELLEAGRAKLAKYQSRNKGKKQPPKKQPQPQPQPLPVPPPPLPVPDETENRNVDRNGEDVDVHKREEEEREQLRQEAEEAKRKQDVNKSEERRKEEEAEREQLRQMRQEAEEARRKQEADEARRKQEVEEARKQEAEERRKEAAEEAKRREAAEEAKRKEAELRRQRIIAEITRKKQLEEEEMKRKERDAEEMRRKEREAEDSQRRLRDEDEFRRKQREEFSTLEQHIQDLTEEKFGLQRELAKAREMTENFVQEHSALVENFNNQGQVVNQLKEEIDELEQRIKEREAYAMALMNERDRAEQDSAAAREQSQAMAGEVIVLENRIRTLRSHELKLEKDMGILGSELESHKKQAASWEKDRAHLQSLIDALQEEKKLLQVRLRKVASGEREFTYNNSEAVQLKQRIMADAATSTEDLPPPLQISSEGPSTPLESPSLDLWHHGRRFEEPLSAQSTSRSGNETSSSDMHSQVLFPESVLRSSQSGGYQRIELPASLPAMPADVMRIINNINDVIASLGEERTAMVKALKAESRGAAELRALNADLSRKLEGTTQQLELVVAQRMADGNSSSVPRNAPAALDYVDEGDEVVDRVLNWIIQLFPGSSRRGMGVKRL